MLTSRSGKIMDLSYTGKYVRPLSLSTYHNVFFSLAEAPFEDN